MKNVIVSALFLLTSLLSISQGGYPKLLLIDGDSIVAITLPQKDKINQTRVDLDECKELVGNITTQALILDSLFDAQEAVSRSLILEVNILEDMNDNRAGIIENLQLDLKRTRRKLKLQKLLRWGGLLAGAAAGFLVPRALNL